MCFSSVAKFKEAVVCAASKQISNETVEEVALAVVEIATGSTILRQMLERCHVVCLSLGLHTVREVLQSVVKWHPYKIHVVQELQPEDLNKRIDFSSRLLARIDVDNV